MTTEQRSRKFDADFKAKAVVRFLEAKAAGKPTIVELAKELGIGDSLLYSWAEKARVENKKAAKLNSAQQKPEARAQYSLELKQQAISMHRNGESITAVAKELGVPYFNVHYWVRNGVERAAVNGKTTAVSSKSISVIPAAVAQAQTPQPRPVNGSQRDALIYLTHAEKKILDMIRDGKISKPDPAHLLTLLALSSLQEAMGK